MRSHFLCTPRPTVPRPPAGYLSKCGHDKQLARRNKKATIVGSCFLLKGNDVVNVLYFTANSLSGCLFLQFLNFFVHSLAQESSQQYTGSENMQTRMREHTLRGSAKATAAASLREAKAFSFCSSSSCFNFAFDAMLFSCCCCSFFDLPCSSPIFSHGLQRLVQPLIFSFRRHLSGAASAARLCFDSRRGGLRGRGPRCAEIQNT